MTKKYFLLSLAAALVLAAGTFLALTLSQRRVKAEYLGPNRTVEITTWSRRQCNWHANMTYNNQQYYCNLTLYYPPTQSCPAESSVRSYFTASACSWPISCSSSTSCTVTLQSSDVQECSPSDDACTAQKKTVTYPPATISGQPLCTNSNGWCIQNAAIDLNAYEPVSGYSISYIEGQNNGTPFQCPGPGDFCTWSLLEGTNVFEAWAHSTFGDTSLKWTVNLNVDTRPPQAQVQVVGTSGQNGWYISPVTVTVSASDPQPGSGLSSCSVALDGVPGSCGRAIQAADGVHQLDWTAQDVAGLQTSGSQTVQVDTRPPQAQAQVVGTSGQNGWYISPVTVTVSASDPQPGSGLSSCSVALDGVPGSCGRAIQAADGVHQLDWTAQDVAGLQTSGSQTVQVDTRPPQAQAQVVGTSGQNGWYISPVTVTVSASDPQPGSGLSSCSVALDGVPGSCGSAIQAADGVHQLDWTAQDVAGLQTSGSQTVQVDTRPPELELSASTSRFCPECGERVSLNMQISDAMSGISSWTLLAGGQTITNGNDGGTHILEWDGGGQSGQVTLLLQAFDIAGNVQERSLTLNLTEPTPTPTPTQQDTATLVHTPTPTTPGIATFTRTPTPIQQGTTTLTRTPTPPQQETTSYTSMPSQQWTGTPTPIPSSTPTTIMPIVPCSSGTYRLWVYIYQDTNRDGTMSPDEGISWLTVYLLDRTYAMMNNTYTVGGRAFFCPDFTYYAQRVYVYVPYLMTIKAVDIPDKPKRDDEVYIAVPAPKLPLYMP